MGNLSNTPSEPCEQQKECVYELRLYVYTGTGNSLWVARQVTSPFPMALNLGQISKKPFKVQGDAVGIVFPVHIWGNCPLCHQLSTICR